MDQYHPEFDAWKFEELSRAATGEEYNRVLDLAEKFGLTRGDRHRHTSILRKLIK